MITRIRRNFGILSVFVAFTAGCIILVVEGSFAQLVNAMVIGAMWALMAAGLALVLGVMNIPHFAHGEFFMIGSYVAYFVFSSVRPLMGKVSPLVTIVVAFVAGFVTGVIVEKFVFYPLRKRTKEQWVMNTFLITVGLSFILSNGANLLIGPKFLGIRQYWEISPLSLFGVRVAFDRIFAIIVAIVAILALWLFLWKTDIGRAIRAVAQDETGTQLVGIDIDTIYMITFALVSALAAMAGATLLFLFPAYPTVGLVPLYFSWFVVILVGLGNVQGAFIGGFIVALIQTITQQFFGTAWSDVVPVLIMVLILLVKPYGIFGAEVRGILEE